MKKLEQRAESVVKALNLQDGREPDSQGNDEIDVASSAAREGVGS